MLGDGRVGQPVPPARDALERAPSDEPAQRVGMDPRIGDFLARDGATPAGEAKQTRAAAMWRNVYSYL